MRVLNKASESLIFLSNFRKVWDKSLNYGLTFQIHNRYILTIYILPGGIAVDDVKFVNCDQPVPADSCDQSDHFWCTSSRACIPREFLCDLSDDCGDNSDEMSSVCPTYKKYDFEGIESGTFIVQGLCADVCVD